MEQMPSPLRNDSSAIASDKPQSVWAFIDMQNLHKGTHERDWQIDWRSFRKYLKEKFGVTRAFAFMGYISKNENLYCYLKQAGFDLEFRPVKVLSNGYVEGGNVDADLACHIMDHKNNYHKAILIADDGDYFKTVQSLNRQNKLKLVISSHLIENTSFLIRQAVNPEMIISIHELRTQIEQRQRA